MTRTTMVFLLIIMLGSVISGSASAKPGPTGQVGQGHIQADMGRHPCLTSTSIHPGHRVLVQPCTTKLNGLQVWKIVKFHDIIVVGLAGHPETCLGAVPERAKQQRRTVYFGRTYNCGQEITAQQGLLMGYIGGHYGTIKQTHGGKLLSAARKQGGGNRFAQWLPSNGSIPWTQVWIWPTFKRVTP